MNGPDQTRIIAPPARWLPVRGRELWAYRELLFFLVWRDLKVKYKQSAIGAAWALLQPLTVMAIFTVLFGKLAHVPSDGLPYPVFAFTGLIPWTYFATALGFASASLVANAPLISKVYFPRLLLPSASCLAALADLAISASFLIVLLPVYGAWPSWRALWLVPLAVLALVTALGCAFWLAATNVRFRDAQYAVPFLIQVGFFATPVAFPSALVPERYRVLLGLNPMTAVVEGFRWALTSKPFPSTPMMLLSVAVGAALFVGGLYYFVQVERDFADVV